MERGALQDGRAPWPYLDGVGQRDGDRQREALGDGHHQHGHADDEEVDQLLQVARLPAFPVDAIGDDAEADDQHQGSEDCNRATLERGKDPA